MAYTTITEEIQERRLSIENFEIIGSEPGDYREKLRTWAQEQ